MRTIWHSLAWKEWHEHKWKIAALSTIVLGVALVASVTGTRWEAIEIAYSIALYSLVPLAIYIASFDATAERSCGTLPQLQALPMTPWKLASVRLVAGLATSVLPIIPPLTLVLLIRSLNANSAVSLLRDLLRISWCGETIPVAPWIWSVYVAGLCAIVVVSFYLWIVSAAARRKDEVSGTAAGFVVVAVLWLSYAWVAHLMHQIGWGRFADFWYCLLPGGLIFALQNLRGIELAAACVIALVVHAALIIWFIRRFLLPMTDSPGSSLNAAAANRQMSLRAPSKFVFTAIIWKQLREIGPIAVLGVVAIVAFVGSIYASDPVAFSEPHQLKKMAEMVIAVVGFMVTTTAGVGVFLNDLSPPLNSFWRSRPINPNHWYWLRFFTCSAVLVALLAFPLIFISHVTRIPIQSGEVTLNFYVTLCTLFTCAVAMTCLIRRAIYAAVLSIGLAVTPFLAIWLVWVVAASVGLIDWPRRNIFDAISTNAALAILCSTSVTATLIGWLAVRYDWGLKS
jgi:hypothetical protein